MPLNAPTLPPDHPINRVTPNFTCPKCKKDNALAQALQYGQGDHFHGKVYHWCAVTPACRGVRCYTPPDDPAAPPPAAVYLPYYPPGFPPGYAPGFPPFAVGGQQEGAPPPMGWPFPPGYPVPPFGPWAAQAPPGPAAQRPPPAAVPQNTTLLCTGPLCTSGANGKNTDGNRACTLKMCKKDCQATLMSYERARRGHDGCNAAGHRRPPFRPEDDVPARSATPPIDPDLLNDNLAVVPAANNASASAATAPLTRSRPGISRSLDLNWAGIGQSQVKQQLAIDNQRQRVTISKQPTVTVHLWYDDGEPCACFEVPVTSLACFSLDVDASAFLKAMGIDSEMFQRYDLSLEKWVMVQGSVSTPVSALQHLLYRVFGVKVCIDFEKSLAAAQGICSAPSIPSARNLQRLGEAATSPPRKRPCSPSPLPARRSSHGPAPSAPTTHTNDDDTFFAPPTPPRSSAAPSFNIAEANMIFPGDFYFCDVVNALDQSSRLAKTRKRSSVSGQPKTRGPILSELLRTKIPMSTLGDVERRLKALKNEQPELYNEFMRYGHTSSGLYSAFKARCQQDRRPHKRAKTTPCVSPPPESGSPSSPIDVDTFSDHAASQRSPSPLSKTIKALEEEQEALRPPLPIDVSRLPTRINWDTVIARAERAFPALEEIIKDPGEHEFCQELRDAFRAKKNGKLSIKQRALVGELVHAGYYGPNGLSLALAMTRDLTNVNLYSEDALSAIRPMSTNVFVERVLIRELILMLMEEDFNLGPDDTTQLYERSKWFGDKHHPADDDDDNDDTDEAAPVVARTAGEIYLQRRARQKYREIHGEEGAF